MITLNLPPRSSSQINIPSHTDASRQQTMRRRCKVKHQAPINPGNNSLLTSPQQSTSPPNPRTPVPELHQSTFSISMDVYFFSSASNADLLHKCGQNGSLQLFTRYICTPPYCSPCLLFPPFSPDFSVLLQLSYVML